MLNNKKKWKMIHHIKENQSYYKIRNKLKKVK